MEGVEVSVLVALSAGAVPAGTQPAAHNTAVAIPKTENPTARQRRVGAL